MKTNNKTENRVQAYLSPSVYKAFREYCQREKLKQSQAIEEILSRFLLEEEKISSIEDNYQDQIKDLASRLTKVEAIMIKTKDYLGKEQINTNSIKVNNQDIEKSQII
ncbi:MAG: hypothetical protein AB4063_12685 [Crocosphaera sp.]